MSASYTFSFYFPQLPPDMQNVHVNSWGGKLGTAFNRAWNKLRDDKRYNGIKNLLPASIGVGPGDERDYSTRVLRNK